MRSLPRHVVALVVSAATAWLALPAFAQVAGDWPMAGGDPTHRGQASGPAPPYREAWRADVESGAMAGPVLAGDVIVVVGREAVVVLDAGTGAFRWATPRDEGPAGPAVVTERGVAVSEGRGKTSEADRGATIVMRDPEDGGRVWESVVESPVVGGLTAVHQGGSELVLAGARDGVLHALDAEDGEEEWTFTGAGALEGAPAVAGGNAVVVAQDRDTGTAAVHAVDLATGKEDWRLRPEGVSITASSATIAGDTVVVGFGDVRVRGIDAATGRLRWQARVRGGFSPRMVPIAADDVTIGDLFGHVYALAPATGRERWVQRVPGSFISASPLAVGDAIVVGDRSGQLAAIDTSTGHLVWKLDTGDREIAGLAADGDRIYASLVNGPVVAFERDPSGTLLDEPSPTTLFAGRAVLNYAVVAVPMYVVLLLAFRMRRRAPDARPAAEEGG